MKKLPAIVAIMVTTALSLFIIQPWSIKLFNMPLQVLLIWLALPALFISSPHQLRSAVASIGIPNLCIIILLFAFVIYRTNADNQDFLRVYQAITGVVITILAAALAADIKKLKLVTTVMICVAGISGMFACLQAIGLVKWTWARTLYQGYSSSVQQPSGLETYPVAYSYSVVGLVILGVTLALHGFLNRSGAKLSLSNFLISCCTLLATLGLIASGSRSGLIGVFAGILACSYLIKKSKLRSVKPITLLAVSISMIALMVVSSPHLSARLFNKLEETSGDARLGSNWEIFGPLIIDNPLGVPRSELDQTAPAAVLDTGKASASEAYKKMNGYDPHNFILTTALFYGILAGILVAMLYIYSIISSIRIVFSHRRYCPTLRTVLTCGLIAANIGLLAHSWFHNASIIIGEMRNWFFLGAMLGSANAMRRIRINFIREQLKTNPLRQEVTLDLQQSS